MRKYFAVIMIGLIIISCTGISDNDEEIFIELSNSSILLMKENSVEITATARDKDGEILDDIDFLWRSSKPDIAEINNDGLIYARKKGYTYITAEYEGFISDTCHVLVPNIDSLYTEVYTDSVVIWHTASLQNCADNLIGVEMQIEGDQITIIEDITNCNFANCLCYFDYSIPLHNLAQGTYTAAVYSNNGSIYYGSVTFIVEENQGNDPPCISAPHQSECYDIF